MLALRRVLIVAEETEQTKRLHLDLAKSGFVCSVVPAKEDSLNWVTAQKPDLVVVALDGHIANAGPLSLARKIKEVQPLPIMALVNKDTMATPDINRDIDDFVVEPHDISEIALRVTRLLHKANGTGANSIRCADLAIDLDKCEVTVGDKVIELTFKEYELLKFLARHPGRVFSRDALLNEVWGDDYYGGDRTVDVHIRRLRSKIEDSAHTFIDTVRNIGYRFRKP